MHSCLMDYFLEDYEPTSSVHKGGKLLCPLLIIATMVRATREVGLIATQSIQAGGWLVTAAGILVMLDWESSFGVSLSSYVGVPWAILGFVIVLLMARY